MSKKLSKTISVILVFLFVVFSVFSANALTLYSDGAYSFTDVSNDYVALYSFDNSSDTLVIPENFNGRYVNSVYDYAFENNTVIKKIDFSQCSGHFTSIGQRAFSGCSSITGKLSIPSSVKSLGIACFENIGAKTVNMNCKVQNIPIQLFNRCSNLEEVHLPVNAEAIDNLAFANCPKLADVYIPSSVRKISDSAFLNSGDFVIHCFYNSFAYNYAKTNDIRYELLDKYDLGDVNLDGIVDVMDVTYIQKYKAFYDGYDLNELTTIFSDVNKDGKVNIRDATLIQMYIAKVISAF